MISGRRQTSLVRPKRERIAATAAASVTEGIYVTGGNDPYCGWGLIGEVDCYTPGNDVWIARAPLDCPERQGHGAVTVQWGEGEKALHAIGGGIGNNVHLVDCDRYVVDNWTARANMPAPARYKAASFTYATRYAIFAGGVKYAGSGTWSTQRDVDEYDPDGDRWGSRISLPYARGDPASFSLGGQGYVCGGDQTTQPMYTTYMYNGSWVLRAPAPSPPRAEHRGFSIEAEGDRPEYGYIVGGIYDVATYAINDLDRYDAVTDSWTSKETCPIRRRWHTAAALGDAGYVNSGKDQTGASPDSCYGYDETQGWFATAPMPSPQRYMAAAASM